MSDPDDAKKMKEEITRLQEELRRVQAWLRYIQKVHGHDYMVDQGVFNALHTAEWPPE